MKNSGDPVTGGGTSIKLKRKGLSLRHLRSFNSLKKPAFRLYLGNRIDYTASMHMETMTRNLLIYPVTGSVTILGLTTLAVVSPPSLMFDSDYLKSWPKSKLLTPGGRDELIPTNQFLEFCQNVPEPKECESIKWADHFWWEYESSLAAKVAAFFTKVL